MACRCASAFITGTSSEYVGRRPLRRLLRERSVVFIAGPRGSGKSEVGRRIAGFDGRKLLVLSTAELHEAIVARVRDGHWSERILRAPGLVLDGPSFLQSRKAALRVLRDLLSARLQGDLRTVVCEGQPDPSLSLLMDDMPTGSMVTLVLRWPASPAGRLRFARRVCDQLEIPRSEAAGTDAIEPWGYPAVRAELTRRKAAMEAAAQLPTLHPADAPALDAVAM